jgi:homoserine kinase type II
LAAQAFPIKQPNLRALAWWQATAPTLTEYLNGAQHELLRHALQKQIDLAASGELAALPYGPAHCDYFRDNVLFTGSAQAPELGGVIDFYFAGCDYWLFDLAVAVNDWCIDHTSGALKADLLDSWLTAYQSVRALTPLERRLWPDMLEAAALRFWISRLYDFYKPRPAETLKPHDPTHFERILEMRVRLAPPAIPEAP